MVRGPAVSSTKHSIGGEQRRRRKGEEGGTDAEEEQVHQQKGTIRRGNAGE